MINEEQITAYREMVKNAGENSMEAQIRANLEATCYKFAGNEDKFDRCMAFLVQCANEILEGKNGDIPDEVCHRICRDYFNDEIWKVEDEENERKKAEEERRAKEKAGTEKPVAAVTEEQVTAESLVKKTAEKRRIIIEAMNKKLGIDLAETIDLFGTGK